MADDRDLLLEEEDLPSPSPAKKPAPVPPVQVVLSPEAIDALFQIRKNELDTQYQQIKNLVEAALADKYATMREVKKELAEYRAEQEYKIYVKWWQRAALQCGFAFLVAVLAVLLFSVYYERTDGFRALKTFTVAWEESQKKSSANDNAAKPEDASVKKPAEKKK